MTQPRLAHRCAALSIVLLAGLVACAPAQADWFDAADLGGVAALPRAVTGPTAGQVAVVGNNAAGGLVGAAHAPGGAFGALFSAAPDNEDFPAGVGPGGAVANADPSTGQPFVRRLHPDGTISGATPVGDPDSAIVGEPAIAPSGALLVLVIDGDGDPQLWRQAADGQPLQQIGPNLPDNASVADIEPNGSNGFLVALAAPIDENGGVRVRALSMSGTTASGVLRIDESPGAFDSVDLVRAIPGPNPIIAYDLKNDTAAMVRAAPFADQPVPQTLGSMPGEDANIDDIEGLGLASGGAAVAWITDDGDTVAGAYAVVGPGAAPLCSASGLSFSAVSLAARGGNPQLAGLTAASTVGLVNISATCPATVVQESAVVPNGFELSTGVDADGTLVALVGRGEDNATRVLVDDTTPPVVGTIGVPAQVQAGRPFQGSVAPSEPWGIAGIAWRIDGQQVARGATVTLPGQPAGRHDVAVTVTNAAGLAATAQTTITAGATTSPAPTPTATPTPIARDTVAPTLSGLALSARCVRTGTNAHLAASFNLSENAQLLFSIRHRVHSPRRSRCPNPRPHTPGPAGTSVQVGVEFGNGVAGPNVATIARRAIALRATARGHRGRNRAHLARLVSHLRPGTYQLVVRATDAAGNRSVDRIVRFWVLTPRRAR